VNATEYAHRRGNCLWRIRKLRVFNAPRHLVRHEQLYLWAYRQWRYGARAEAAMVYLPRWQENYQKFVLGAAG
jgi:hypothetical protein